MKNPKQQLKKTADKARKMVAKYPFLHTISSAKMRRRA